MIERDIWLTANEMIKQFGDQAGIYAALRAGAMYDQGDEAGYALWKRVYEAVQELTASVPTQLGQVPQ